MFEQRLIDPGRFILQLAGVFHYALAVLVQQGVAQAAVQGRQRAQPYGRQNDVYQVGFVKPVVVAQPAQLFKELAVFELLLDQDKDQLAGSRFVGLECRPVVGCAFGGDVGAGFDLSITFKI